MVRRSRKYNFVPTSVGTVQARFFKTLTFEITFNSVGDSGCQCKIAVFVQNNQLSIGKHKVALGKRAILVGNLTCLHVYCREERWSKVAARAVDVVADTNRSAVMQAHAPTGTRASRPSSFHLSASSFKTRLPPL